MILFVPIPYWFKKIHPLTQDLLTLLPSLRSLISTSVSQNFWNLCKCSYPSKVKPCQIKLTFISTILEKGILVILINSSLGEEIPSLQTLQIQLKLMRSFLSLRTYFTNILTHNMFLCSFTAEHGLFHSQGRVWVLYFLLHVSN